MTPPSPKLKIVIEVSQLGQVSCKGHENIALLEFMNLLHGVINANICAWFDRKQDRMIVTPGPGDTVTQKLGGPERERTCL